MENAQNSSYSTALCIRFPPRGIFNYRTIAIILAKAKHYPKTTTYDCRRTGFSSIGPHPLSALTSPLDVIAPNDASSYNNTKLEQASFQHFLYVLFCTVSLTKFSQEHLNIPKSVSKIKLYNVLVSFRETSQAHKQNLLLVLKIAYIFLSFLFYCLKFQCTRSRQSISVADIGWRIIRVKFL